MCCFSPVVQSTSFVERLFRPARVHVANTNIYARRAGPSGQMLVYAMQFGAASDVAMILPLPVAPSAGEGAVEFVNFEQHSTFFVNLARLFNPPMPAAARGPVAFAAPQARAPLPVHEVGAFEASFVPTLHDFVRLDARFRLPESVWRRVGGYDDYGFAVFRLAPSKKSNVHPMALQFQTRDPSRLFFPTVHIHDGHVHRRAAFDHSLYYQGTNHRGLDSQATLAEGDERALMPIPAQLHPILEQGSPLYRRRLHGKLPNRDTWIALGASPNTQAAQ